MHQRSPWPTDNISCRCGLECANVAWAGRCGLDRQVWPGQAGVAWGCKYELGVQVRARQADV